MIVFLYGWSQVELHFTLKYNFAHLGNSHGIIKIYFKEMLTRLYSFQGNMLK